MNSLNRFHAVVNYFERSLRTITIFATLVLSLAGVFAGQAFAVADVSISPASPFAFGSKALGTSTSQVFTVSSLRPAVPVRITAITAPLAASRFTITGGTCAAGFTLTATPCTLAVTFAPNAAQAYVGEIQVATAPVGGNPGTPVVVSLTGTGIAAAPVTPSIVVTPASMVFPAIPAGTQSGVQTFTVRNNGTVNATITSLGANLSTPGSFIDAGDTCGGATLAPNQTCIVQVRFTPATAGSYSGFVGFVVQGVAGIAAQGAVSGTATAPPLVPPVLSPAAVVFPGNTTVGSSSTPQVLTLSNPNAQTITPSVTVNGPGFARTATTCAATLAANATCTITVVFTPTNAGAATGSVAVTSSAGNTSASLSATAINPVPLSLSPAAINFGSIVVGQSSAPQTATLSNPNTVAVAVTSVTLTGPGFAQSNACPASLPAGGSCTITLTYTPGAAGTTSGALQVATALGNLSASLTGAGAAVSLVPPRAAPAVLTFGPQTVGTTSAPQTVTVTNPNAQSINLTGLTGDATFIASAGTCAATLAPQQSCTYSVVFKPSAAGSASATLTAGSNAGTTTIAASGPGVAVVVAGLAPPSLSLASWDFGSVSVGSQSPNKTVTLKNDNAVALSPLQIATSTGFTQSNNCGLSLASGATCQINVQYTATTVGALTGTLTVSVPGAANAQALSAQATLKGLGIAAPIVTPPTSVASGSVISATPRFMQASVSAATSQFITYSFTNGNPRVTVADGIFCTTLTAPAPVTGATGTYPCAANSEFARHPTDSTTFQTVQQNGSVVRATETIRIPAAVTRTAQNLGAATFYFVRRFEPQGYAVVEIRATGSIVNAPVALNDARLAFDTAQGPQPLVFIQRASNLPPVTVTLGYTGSGMLRGRWELVQPGDVAPTERDLLPEASLPRSERGTQRRYMLLQRFEQMLNGAGRIDIKVPAFSAAQGVSQFDGQYQLLLRIEAEPSIYGGESGAANFAMPLLRYFVGSIVAPPAKLEPINASAAFSGERPTFAWSAVPQARYYRIEVADRNNTVIYSAIVRDTERSYSALSALNSGAGNQWRVQALDAALQPVGESPWRGL